MKSEGSLEDGKRLVHAGFGDLASPIETADN
jgi:hypothetical protein